MLVTRVRLPACAIMTRPPHLPRIDAPNVYNVGSTIETARTACLLFIGVDSSNTSCVGSNSTVVATKIHPPKQTFFSMHAYPKADEHIQKCFIKILCSLEAILGTFFGRCSLDPVGVQGRRLKMKPTPASPGRPTQAPRAVGYVLH